MLRDFSDTVAFVKVVQEGSFTAAARMLKVPKTRVSRKVQELESRLQTQLLNRTTRSLKLTEAGAVYFQHCERVVKNLEDAENAVAELQQHPRELASSRRCSPSFAASIQRCSRNCFLGTRSSTSSPRT